MSVRSWLRDKLEELGDLIYRTIIKPAVDFLKRMIEEIAYRIRVFRHKLHEVLAEWFKNDWFFLAFVVGLATLLIFSKRIKEFIGNVKLYQLIKVLVEKIKAGVIDLKKLNLIIDLKLMHQISKVFFVEYREVMKSFSDAISQLSSELGEGSAYLHAYFASLRMIKMGSGAVLGLDMEVVEASWYNDTTDFLKKANDNFRRYARDPGLLYYDFLDWQIRNAYDTYKDLRQAEVKEIADAHNRVTEIDKGLVAVEQGLELFIGNLPPTVRTIFQEQIGPYQDALSNLAEAFHESFMPMFGELAAAFYEHHEMQTRLNAKADENQARIDRMLSSPWEMGTSELHDLGGGYEYALDAVIAPDVDDFGNVVNRYAHDMDSITAAYIKSLGVSAALGYEQPYSLTVRKLSIDIPSPFVGDY